MQKHLVLESPAKLNLMLHITGQRDDGYHLLQTVFQLVGLNDTVEFSLRNDNQILRTNQNRDIPADDDLMVRAAKLLQSRYKVEQGVDISINKLIPMGGGLGGGSSNAATTLMAMNKLWELNLTSTQLRKTGLELGADVPIFIFGQNAWAEGVGECLEPIKLPEKWFVIVHPQVFVSTPQIFSSKDLTRDCHPITIRAFLEGRGSNVCEPVACKLHPEIGEAIQWLSRFSPARMTGTGACVFAAFNSEAQANDVKSRLPEQWNGFVAPGLDKNPVAAELLPN